MPQVSTCVCKYTRTGRKILKKAERQPNRSPIFTNEACPRAYILKCEKYSAHKKRCGSKFLQIRNTHSRSVGPERGVFGGEWKIARLLRGRKCSRTALGAHEPVAHTHAGRVPIGAAACHAPSDGFRPAPPVPVRCYLTPPADRSNVYPVRSRRAGRRRLLNETTPRAAFI